VNHVLTINAALKTLKTNFSAANSFLSGRGLLLMKGAAPPALLLFIYIIVVDVVVIDITKLLKLKLTQASPRST